MVGYVFLALFAVAAIWLAIHIRRHPPMPDRKPFEADHGESLVGTPRKAPDPTAYANLRAGDGAGFGG
jgi:hypothetical protein